MKILFVDDEKRWTEPYIRELEELQSTGFHVHYEATVDGAWSFFLKNQKDIVLLILDIMMAPGKLFIPEEARNGLRTGVRLYEKMRAEAPNLPIIMLTNVSDERIKEKFAMEANCLFVRKPECFPYELVDKVRNFLDRRL